MNQELKEAYNNSMKVLNNEELFNRYYIKRKNSIIDELISTIQFSEQPIKILFTGHRYSGKTTELLGLKFRLQNDYAIIYFSAEEKLDFMDIDYIDILLMMIIRTLDYAEKNKIAIDEEIEKELHNLIKQALGEEFTETEEKKSTGLGIVAKFLIIEGKIKTESETRKTIRKNLEHIISDLLSVFTHLIADIKSKHKKELLLIIDDLEKMDLVMAENAIFKHSNVLTSIGCKIIYTAPFPLIYGENGQHIQRMYHTFTLPIVHVKNRDKSLNEDNIKFLREIVLKRVKKELIDDQALDYAIECSGGLIGDLLTRLIPPAIIHTISRQSSKIERVDITHAFLKIVDSYRLTIKDEYYNRLSYVYKNKDSPNDDQLRILLHLLAVLHYDTKAWYDVHPAIVELLKEKGYYES